MILIIGSGLSGAVLAERFANILNQKVLILEKRNHIGGNCYDFIDPSTGILMNQYGAHLFHTNHERVWEYIQSFSNWIRWEHTVLSYVDKKYVSVPVNITTINRLCSENLKTSEDANKWLEENQVVYEEITNSEQMAKSRVGEILYEKMFKPYTIKQWNKDPSELNPSVLSRIPIYNNFDTRYFTDKYQALPEKGYTKFIESMLSNPNITIQVNTDFFEWKQTNSLDDFEYIFFTGPIDTYFNQRYEPLEYRSIDFHIERHMNTRLYQPNSVVNYPELNVSFTRIVEYKHFLHQESPHTIIVSETTTDTGEPYYPVPTPKNMELFNQYKQLADEEQTKHNVHFIGRLANYKYFNMDQAILNSLEYFDKLYTTSHENV
jgi:UDP-galactopyranose mutase